MAAAANVSILRLVGFFAAKRVDLLMSSELTGIFRVEWIDRSVVGWVDMFMVGWFDIGELVSLLLW